MKRQRQPPSDASWCLGNLATLDLKSFALHFGLTYKAKTSTRYKNSISKWIENAAVRINLLNDFDRWSATVDFVTFWQERARTATIVQSRADCSSFIDCLLEEVTPKNQLAYGENIHQNRNVVEQENNAKRWNQAAAQQ